MTGLVLPSPSAHVVVFPHMAQGHALPLLDICKALTSLGVKVTIIATPKNAPLILSKVLNYSEISLRTIQFPRVPELPEGCENTADLPSMALLVPFLKATESMRPAFECVLKEMLEARSRPLCVISDFFLGWTLDVCRSFGIPRIVFHGMGILSMVITKGVNENVPSILAMPDSDPIELPKLSIPFTVNKCDITILERCEDPNDSFLSILAAIGEADANSEGVIVNSFEELEGDYIVALEKFYCQGARAWCIGPALLYDQNQIERPVGSKQADPSQSYIEWLDERVASGRVMYVSFGTQAHLSDMQMDNIAHGLQMAGHLFIWAVKSATWVSSDNGWEDRLKGRGLILHNWVDQRRILSHPAVGGFLSHCGWNSVLESLAMGVPILAWPMGAEQPFNAKLVVTGLKAGVMVRESGVGGTVASEVIRDGVKELMGGERGRQARDRAREIGRLARHKALPSQHRFGEGKSVIIIMKYPSSAFRGGVISCTVRVQLEITLLKVVAETTYYQAGGSAEIDEKLAILCKQEETLKARLEEFVPEIKPLKDERAQYLASRLEALAHSEG
ncbi:UDP-glycosyltransferase 90A1 [Eucalyptus grandis]|uniref:UDP-glycosyltransferase 90A1 n=1 Tax=Eucalyptus grandis TaxID=71139 RepID=UPI00192E8D53|nr:UDP-glycosyltransferase 90A1 [Eucalyptus grandis]